jgi:hypothetical protein
VRIWGVAPELSDPVGPCEVGEHEDVKHLGAGSQVHADVTRFPHPVWRQRLRCLTPVPGQAPRPLVVRAPGLPGRG